MKNLMKKLELAIGIIGVIFLAWVIFSWIQICTFNLSENPWEHYSGWNFFIILLRNFH